MKTLKTTLVAALLAFAGGAQARDATPFLPIVSEAAPKLIVEQPLPEPLAARGAVIIPYSTENIRILPVFGSGALQLSPRAGHLHVTVDDLPWHWADAGNGNTVVVVGLPAGPHKLLIELATPDHKVIAGQTVSFDVPSTSGDHH